MDLSERLSALRQGRLAPYAVYLASNRGPVELAVLEGGDVRLRRGPGGLVTAMRSAVARVDATWFAAAMSDADVAAAHLARGEIQVPVGSRTVPLHLLTPNRADFHRYYDEISNRLLWFLLHGIGYSPAEPDFDPDLWHALAAYRRVNQAFAARLAQDMDRTKPPLVLVQDYHLFLVPGFLRRSRPEARILHFTHVPWPGPDSFRPLVGSFRVEILESLLAADVVGFHTWRYVRNFCLTCQEFLDADVDLDRGLVQYRGRTVRVSNYPISIDPSWLENFAKSAEVRRHERVLARLAPDDVRIILQVARTDPSKNVLRAFKAFDLFLQQNPGARGRTALWSILPATRQGGMAYRRYLDQVGAQARRLEALWGTERWRPITLFTEDNYARAIAAMKRYDVMLINSLADGMNLVAKEGPIVNQRDGVLVLSENAGAAEELGNGALLIHPHDVLGTAQALAKGLALPGERRKQLIGRLRGQIWSHPIAHWLLDQLTDLIAEPPMAKTAATRNER
ncbi:MAG: trehalose-6-phosphate synthase [Cyanobacteria bacterium REEB65]|nr:trehalose-6-phosphate synthase [Cyanobacteria bacterium REEB65]